MRTKPLSRAASHDRISRHVNLRRSVVTRLYKPQLGTRLLAQLTGGGVSNAANPVAFGTPPHLYFVTATGFELCRS